MKYIYIREQGSNKPIHFVDVTNKSERQIDKVVDGMTINLYNEKYWIDDTCQEEMKPQCENKSY
jgi:hypothetical protein